MIAALVLFCLLVLSVFTQVGGLLSRFAPSKMVMQRTGGPRLEEIVLQSGKSDNKIAVVPLEGVIMGESIDGSGFNLVQIIQEQLKRAAEDDEVKAVLLKVDSPGGEVLASDEIYKAIQKFQKNSKKPVVASMGTVAASGGYYVSAPCQWIVANEMTITGSIGVIMSSINYRALMDKVGVRPEVFKSGKFKDMLRGSKADNEIQPEERKMIQDLIDETFQQFKSIVGEGRSFAEQANKGSADKAQSLAPDWASYADGRIFSGKEALKLGFVDELGNFDTAVARAKKLAGIQDASVVQYQQTFDLSNLLRFFGKTDFKSGVKVDLGLDMPKLKAGRLYFVAPTFVH